MISEYRSLTHLYLTLHISTTTCFSFMCEALFRGGPFDTWGGLWFFLREQTIFFTPSLNVQFFSDLIKSKQFFSQR